MRGLGWISWGALHDEKFKQIIRYGIRKRNFELRMSDDWAFGISWKTLGQRPNHCLYLSFPQLRERHCPQPLSLRT